MQAPAWSRASCDLHLIFPSLCMVMWAPSHRGRGWIPEADHMLVEPVEVARNAVRRFKGCSCKAFPWWHLKISSCNPDTKFWVSSGPSTLHWKRFAVNWQIICFYVSLCVCALASIWFWSQKEKRNQTHKLKDMLKPILIDGLFCVVRQSIHLLHL